MKEKLIIFIFLFLAVGLFIQSFAQFTPEELNERAKWENPGRSSWKKMESQEELYGKIQKEDLKEFLIVGSVKSRPIVWINS